jgi:hypothetical protein
MLGAASVKVGLCVRLRGLRLLDALLLWKRAWKAIAAMLAIRMLPAIFRKLPLLQNRHRMPCGNVICAICCGMAVPLRLLRVPPLRALPPLLPAA